MCARNQTILKIENVCFSYHQQPVLCDISFDVQQGEFLSLLGASGCGKTTLLRLIAGLEQVERGRILTPMHKGHDLKVGMVFQDLALFPHMSVARNVGYALRHLSRAARRARTDEMLDLVNLLDKRTAFPHELSGGQKQRLALARALAAAPDLILLDEPFAAQDTALRAHLRDEVMHILRKANVTAILVTHDPEEAMQFSDRIAVLDQGALAQIGSPVDVYNAPESVFIASFFGQINIIKGVVSQGYVATPLGSIAAPHGFNDETAVQIVVRPEALKLGLHDPAIDHHDIGHEHAHGYISERKYLGRSTLIHLDTHDLDSEAVESLHLHARVAGVFHGAADDVQDITLDHSQIFVFEDNAAA